MSATSDPPKASKDCPKCVIRRIKCDRNQPECRKCRSRNLPCPGYGLILKWNQGIASRGKFKGQVYPLNIRTKQNQTSTQIPSPPPESDDSSTSESTDLSLSIHRERSLNKYPAPVPNFLQDTSTRQLLRHFNHEIAPILAWVDSPENPWRKLVLPLATESEAVLYSILTLSSQHLSTKYRDDQLVEVRSNMNTYRNKALLLLAEKLRQEREALAQSSRAGHEEAINAAVASMLVLFNADLTQAETKEWNMHIRGARAIIRGLGDSPHLPDPNSDTSAFLYQEFFAISTYAIMTKFHDDDEMNSATLKSDGNAIFIEFLRIIHNVTIQERQRYNEARQGLPLTSADLNAVHESLNQAKVRTLMFSQNMDFDSANFRRDFDHVVTIFYTACLIYSFQALAMDSISKQDLQTHRNTILGHLDLVTHRHSFAQDLFWPIFIAGTASHGDKTAQDRVEIRTLEVIQMSGALDRRRALAFLKAFWSQQDVGVTWIEMARTWSGGRGFMLL